jgi:hypothetical protein
MTGSQAGSCKHVALEAVHVGHCRREVTQLAGSHVAAVPIIKVHLVHLGRQPQRVMLRSDLVLEEPACRFK